MSIEVENPWVSEGSIKLIKEGRKKGKWRLQWAYFDGPRKVTVDKLFEKKGDATTWRDEKKVDLKTGARKTAVKAKANSFITLGGMWTEMAGTKALDYRDGKWVASYGDAPQTVKTKQYRWDKWVKNAPIASRTVRALVRDDAYEHVEWMRTGGASIATMTDVLGVLKLLVNCAVVEKSECQTMANPFVRISLQTNEEKARTAVARQMVEALTPSKIVLSPRQAREGLEKLADLEALALLGIHTLAGLRLSEGMALCVEQLDFARGVILVDRAVHLGANGQQYVGLPKRNKIRLAAMCRPLSDILEAYVATLPADRSFLFSAESEDKPTMRYRYYDLWKWAVLVAGLPEAYTTQDGRVTCNNWIEKLMPSVSPSTRLEHMGHSVGRGSGAGMVVNINNYTGHIPEAYATLGWEIDRTVFADARPILRIEEGSRAA